MHNREVLGEGLMARLLQMLVPELKRSKHRRKNGRGKQFSGFIAEQCLFILQR